MKREISPFIRLNQKDNVVVARRDVPAGMAVESEGFTTRTEVPAGYKAAARDIRKGEPILKYNTCIGFAAEDTPAGTMMHSHNIVFEHVDLDYAFSRDYHPTELLPPEQRATFQGFVRPDGRVATRNYIGILVASNCAATVARKIANHFTPERLAAYPNVSGVVPFVTGLGCGMEMTGPFMDLLRRTIMGYATNPNLGAAIVTALGCERNNIDGMFEHAGLQESETLQKLVIQDVGGTAKAVEEGIRRVEQLLPVVNACRRQTVSAEHLVLALECGGSDGFSGLSANPALGRAVDLLVKNGGTAILSETTEIFGVEHTLTRRARTPEVGQKLVDHINWWLKYNEGKDCQINGRVSPGNNKGGLANVLEKSLGGAKKGGETALNEVYDYAEKVTEHGLVFMNTPATTLWPPPARWLAAPPWWPSPPAAAPASAVCPPPCSSWPATPPCTSGWRGTWISTAGSSSTVKRIWTRWGSSSLSVSSKWPPAIGARANCWAWVKTSLCPGPSACWLNGRRIWIVTGTFSSRTPAWPAVS